MKSKTSESLIASESRAGIKKDGADQHKQKPLKKGKDLTLTAVKIDESFPSLLFHDCPRRMAHSSILRRSVFKYLRNRRR